MTNFTSSVRAWAAVPLVLTLVWQGYQRRRSSWSQRTWVRFGGWLSIPAGGLGLALAMATAVDRGIYQHLPHWVPGVYVTLMMLLLLGGVITMMWLLLGFAGIARWRPRWFDEPAA